MRSEIIPASTQRCINVDSMAHNTVSMAHTVIKHNNVESMLLQRRQLLGYIVFCR